MRDPLIKNWLNDLIQIEDVQVEWDRPAYSGPDPLVGRPQVVVSPAAGWRITYHGALAHRGSVHAFRAMLARQRGFVHPVYVGPYDLLNGPVRRANATSPVTSTFSDGTIFSDGTYWATPIFDCILSASASEGDVEISVTNSVYAPLKAGDYFELDGRLHLVESIDESGIWSVWPPLRADYASATVLEITDPRMKAYLDINDSQALRLQHGHWGSLSLTFVEAGW